MPSLLRTLALVTAPALLGVLPPGETIAYEPKEGTVLLRRIRSEWALEREQGTLTVDVTSEKRGIGARDTFTFTLVTDDLIGEVTDGHPLGVDRTYRTVNLERIETPAEGDVAVPTRTRKWKSGAQNAKVEFLWNRKEERYDRRDGEPHEEGEDGIDDAVLAALDEDLDFRFLLPPTEVEKDDSWEIDPTLFAAILTPGGAIWPRPFSETSVDPTQDDLALPEGFPWEYVVEPTGKITGRFLGVRETDGTRFARIEIRGTLEDEADLVELYNPLGAREYLLADTDFEMEGRGELVWNLDRGLPASFLFAGTLRLSFNAEWNVMRRGWPVAVGYIQERAGTFRLQTASD